MELPQLCCGELCYCDPIPVPECCVAIMCEYAGLAKSPNIGAHCFLQVKPCLSDAWDRYDVTPSAPAAGAVRQVGYVKKGMHYKNLYNAYTKAGCERHSMCSVEYYNCIPCPVDQNLSLLTPEECKCVVEKFWRYNLKVYLPPFHTSNSPIKFVIRECDLRESTPETYIEYGETVGRGRAKYTPKKRRRFYPSVQLPALALGTGPGTTPIIRPDRWPRWSSK